MLRVSLIGNLGGDPEVRYTQKGSQIVSFNVAVNQVRYGPDGERLANTEWFRIKVSGRQAEFAQKLSKGTRVLIFGRLDISHYTSKDGEPRTGFDVWADDVQSVSSRRESDDDEGSHEHAASRPSPNNGHAPAPRPAADSDSADLEDLPF